MDILRYPDTLKLVNFSYSGVIPLTNSFSKLQSHLKIISKKDKRCNFVRMVTKIK